MNKVLVTGGAGFIGSNLVDELVEMGYEVMVVDNLESGKKENLNPKAKFIERNICEDLNAFFRESKFDCVFHLAAIPSVQFSIENPDRTHENNVNGTLNLLEMCRKYGVKRFVFSSSSSIYGDQDEMPLKESMKPNPMSPYALHKLIGEYYSKLYNFLYGVETIALRYFNVYGERQDPNGAYTGLIPKFIRLLEKNDKPIIYGDGEQTRDFIYVKDVVNANILASKVDNKEAFGEAFNIGSGSQTSVNEVAGKIKDFINSSIEIEHGASVVEPKNSFSEISKADDFFGWKPEMNFEDGLKRTIKWFMG